MENQQERAEAFSQVSKGVEDDYLTPHYSFSDFWELLAEIRI